MSSTRNLRVLPAVIVTSLVVAACGAAGSSADDAVPSTVDRQVEGAGAGDPGGPDGQTDTGDPGDLDPADLDPADLDTAMSRIAVAYDRIDGAWTGFVPNEHPVVLAWKAPDGTLLSAITINHPDPGAIGSATPVEVDGFTPGTVHRIDDVGAGAAERLDGIDTFDFGTEIGGVDSFVQVAGGPDAFFDPTTVDYASTLLHELFHRYQFQSFAAGDGPQDVEGYDYRASNLELAALEERALSAALAAAGDGDADRRDEAARRFVAIRLTRLDADERVRLDESQEALEGTARFLEHRLGRTDDAYTYHDGNFAAELRTDPTTGPVKEHYGFGRWYATGAAVVHLAESAGADDVAARVEDGASPAEVLRQALGLDGAPDATIAELVADARLAYDPDGELPDLAVEAAATAEDEGPVFGGDGNGDGDSDSRGESDVDGVETDGDGDGMAITDEELACLDDFGVELEPDDDGFVEIPDDAVEACFA
ncbi:MAG: hypothetical protein AAGA93_01880 [Actinomycetota bacterium]